MQISAYRLHIWFHLVAVIMKVAGIIPFFVPAQGPAGCGGWDPSTTGRENTGIPIGLKSRIIPGIQPV